MNDSNEPKSEATFEAHLGAVLKAIFPGGGVAITHQVQFTLRLGHHEKEIDGRKGWSKGRLDVLISSAAGHAAVLELKREDIDLTDEDRDQGLSYARLLQPMPPLVIVSNGRTTRFYTTIDGNEWSPKDFSEEVFAKLIASAAARAAAQRDEAIRSLLASDPTVWADILRSFTKDAITRRTGDLDDLSTPFARVLDRAHGGATPPGASAEVCSSPCASGATSVGEVERAHAVLREDDERPLGAALH